VTPLQDQASSVCGKDREMGGYIKPVSGQRLGKHVPAATVTHAVLYTWSAPRTEAEFSLIVGKSSTLEAVKIECERVELKNLHC
jgi:hypothetical protein